uniref:Si:dkey-67c22.2 n=1 Tax=Nothobranchius kadleci TaxID=1051664 RepID=A0A1A8BKY4_NOTKA
MECAVDVPSGGGEAPEKDDVIAKEATEPPHKKNKKHKKHKSKKKKRKRKGEKESSSESGAESDAEPPPPPRPVRTTRASARLAAAAGSAEHAGLKTDGKKDAVSAHAEAEGETKSKKHKKQTAKKKKKKKKKDEKQERKSPSRSPSESSSASGSESEGEGAKTAGDGKFVPAAGSEPKEPISKLVPKGKVVEEEVAPVLMQKPEVLEVKKEEMKDMDVSSFGGKTSCTDVSENMRSPSTGQNEVTQIEAVKEKAEDSHGDGTFSCAQELPDIIPKQEGTTPKDDPALKDQTSSVQEGSGSEEVRIRPKSVTIT